MLTFGRLCSHAHVLENYFDFPLNISLFISVFSLFFVLFWFINHPSLRYGGYIPIAIFVFSLISFFIRNLDLPKNFNRNAKILIILVLLVFNVNTTIMSFIKMSFPLLLMLGILLLLSNKDINARVALPKPRKSQTKKNLYNLHLEELK